MFWFAKSSVADGGAEMFDGMKEMVIEGETGKE